MRKAIFYSLCLFLLFNCSQPLKQFYIYDAMSYAGKPDLKEFGLSPVYLMYEASLTKRDPNNPKSVLLDFEKINAQVEFASLFPDIMVSTDIEHWFYDATVTEAEMGARFDSLFNAFRNEIPNIFIGNYGIAPSALCIHRYYRPSFSEDSILSTWRINNRKRWIPLQYADVAQPSVYIAEPNIESWINDLKTTVNEIKQHEPNKNIIVYIWPQYYDKANSPYYKKFIRPEIWRQMLEAVYEYCDGAIIWSSRTDEEDKTVKWSDPRVQANWEVTKEFLLEHKKNIVQPSKLPDLIDPVKREKSFEIFAYLDYPQTPDIHKIGVKPIYIIKESDITTGVKNRISQPDSVKIARLAKKLTSDNLSAPVCISASSWIRDRMSDNDAMMSRYEMVQRIFKANNTTNPLSFTGVSPTSLSSLRVTSSNFFTNLGGWKMSAVNTTRNLSQFADVLVPSTHAIDNDTTVWKTEFYLAIQEARKVNEGKPIYAYFYTEYINDKDNFIDAYNPVNESTWLCMLNAAYNMCDGVVFTNRSNNQWNDDFGFWKATTKFMGQKGIN